MMKRYLLGLILCLMLVILISPVLAEEADDITGQCTLFFGEKKVKTHEATDRNYETFLAVSGKPLEVRSKEPMGSVWLQIYDRGVPCELQVEKDGKWETWRTMDSTRLSLYETLPDDCTAFRIAKAGKGRIFLAEITVLGTGEKPGYVPEWRECEKADMMLLVAHPDDDLLWFGGLLPTYAGERQKRVQVMYLVPSTPNRRLELLDGLWTCGVTDYPHFGYMRDTYAGSLKQMYQKWDKKSVWTKVTAAIRRYRPEVLVTQDIDGEYGHGAHRACADASIRAVTGLAADEKFDSKSLEQYGPWQVKKLYIHMYGENVLQLDWHRPLAAFDGKDGITVCMEAMKCHVSQVKHGWMVTDGGTYDNSLFGLYYSEVGPDENGDDMLEHIGEEV